MGREILRRPLGGTETASFSKRSFLLFLLLGNEFARWRCRFTLDGDTRQVAAYFLIHKHILELQHPSIPRLDLVLGHRADKGEDYDLVLTFLLRLDISTTHRCASMVLTYMNTSIESILHQTVTATSPALARRQNRPSDFI